MPIITISRGSYSYGKAVAEQVARKLNYACISREDLLNASQHFNIPEIKLRKAIENAPSFLDRITHGKEKYIAYIRLALLQYALKDNVVYHGFAGHLLLKDVPSVLKVRICAPMQERAKVVMAREHVNEEEAFKVIEKIDAARKKWSLQLYGQDPHDLMMYDLGLVISCFSVSDVIENIMFTTRLHCFKTTLETREVIGNLTLAAEVKVNLMHAFPEAEVRVEKGVAIVRIQRNLAQQEALTDDITEIVMQTAGIQEVRVNVIPF